MSGEALGNTSRLVLQGRVEEGSFWWHDIIAPIGCEDDIRPMTRWRDRTANKAKHGRRPMWVELRIIRRTLKEEVVPV